MKLRLDLLLPLLLVATAGAYQDTPSNPATKPAPTETCARNAAIAQPEAEARIAAEGYAEVRILGVGCDNAWHALALAEGDPVRLKVTPHGAVLTE